MLCMPFDLFLLIRLGENWSYQSATDGASIYSSRSAEAQNPFKITPRLQR